MSSELNPYAAPQSPGELVPPSPDAVTGRLKLTAIGLKLIYVAILVILVCWIATVGLAIAVAEFYPGITVIIAMIAFAIMNVGPILCLSVPAGYGLRSFATATVLAQMTTLVCFAVSFRMSPVYLNLLVLAMTIATGSLFLMFLHRLAQCIGRPDLVKRSRNVGVGGAVVLFAVLPSMWLSQIMEPSYQLSIVMAIGFISGTVLVIVMYANLINALAIAIRRPLAKVASEEE